MVAAGTQSITWSHSSGRERAREPVENRPGARGVVGSWKSCGLGVDVSRGQGRVAGLASLVKSQFLGREV